MKKIMEKKKVSNMLEKKIASTTLTVLSRVGNTEICLYLKRNDQ